MTLARLVDTVVFPVPPLPLATATLIVRTAPSSAACRSGEAVVPSVGAGGTSLLASGTSPSFHVLESLV
jgi:hypothetical protein